MDNLKSKIEEPRCTGSTAYSCSLPALRFNITFDVDLNFLLSKFTKNATQIVPVKIECGVEKLHG